MLVSQIDEILEVLPTARWKDQTKLLGQIEDEESAMMQPILGNELLDELNNTYRELIGNYGKITTAALVATDIKSTDLMPVRLIRQIQKALILRMMADNASTLSVSFNEGGGLNRMASDSYESLSNDEIKELKSEYWHNSITAIEGVLLMLERDALSPKPLWKDKWQSSEWYFQHSDLLFPTLRSLIPFFPMQKKERRVEYNEMLPEIRFCQNTYILPMLGQDLIDKILEEENGTTKKTLQLVRTALGIFIRARVVRTPPHSKSETQHQLADLEASAQQALHTAIKYMLAHADELKPAIEQAQFYKPEPKPDSGKHTHCHDERKEYDTFSTLL